MTPLRALAASLCHELRACEPYGPLPVRQRNELVRGLVADAMRILSGDNYLETWKARK